MEDIMIGILTHSDYTIFYNDKVEGISSPAGKWILENTEFNSEIDPQGCFTALEDRFLVDKLFELLVDVQMASPDDCFLLEDLLDYLGYF
jgi:hypothetical protein